MKRVFWYSASGIIDCFAYIIEGCATTTLKKNADHISLFNRESMMVFACNKKSRTTSLIKAARPSIKDP